MHEVVADLLPSRCPDVSTSYTCLHARTITFRVVKRRSVCLRSNRRTFFPAHKRGVYITRSPGRHVYPDASLHFPTSVNLVGKPSSRCVSSARKLRRQRELFTFPSNKSQQVFFSSSVVKCLSAIFPPE